MIKLLYVDDEADFLELAKHFLTKPFGYDLKTTNSVKKALVLLENNKYEAIISDYQMPGIDGIEFLKIVRQQFKDIPFILFTGKGREEIAIEAINNGATFYVQKGTDIQTMFAELKQGINQSVEVERLSFNFEAIISFLRYVVENDYIDIEKTLKKICDLLEAEVAYTAIIKNRELVITHELGIQTEAFKNMIVPYGYGLGWDVVLSSKGKIVNDYLTSVQINHETNIDIAVEKEKISSAMAVPISSPAGNIGTLYIFTRTERKFFEDDLQLASFFGSVIEIKISREKKLNEEEKLKTDLIETNKKLNIISSNSRHTINNRITEILGYLEIISETTEEDNTKNYIAKIVKSINKIIDDSKRSNLYQKVGVNNPIWHSARHMEEAFSKVYNLKIINNAKDLEILADPLLMIAADNLVLNTIMHGKKADTVTISYQILPDRKAVFIYEDNGIGVRVEDKENIFKHGFGKNTGIGLYLVKEIVHSSNMEIREVGEYLKGVRFETIIPEGKYRIIK